MFGASSRLVLMLKKNSSHTRIIYGLLRESCHCITLCETRYCWVQVRILVRSEIFRSRPDRPRGHPASCAVGVGYVPWVKWLGRGADHALPHLAPRLRKSRSIIHLFSAFMVCYRVNFTLLFPYRQDCPACLTGNLTVAGIT